MRSSNAARTEESRPMLKWLVLPMATFAYLAGTVGAGAPRDRDRDGLPDRWERKYHLSTSKPSAKRDPDGDRLKNRRELRLRTHPRRADTDRDRLRDGAEVRRFHTNPRRRDTDGDGFRDRCELRKQRNPRKRRSRPKRRCSKSPPAPLRRMAPGSPGGSPPPSTGGLPGPENTGVPPGTTLTPSGGITVKRDGTVIDGVDAPWIDVQAANVTIRNSRVGSTSFSAIFNRTDSPGLVVEDTTLANQDGTCISSSNFTARRVEMTGCENGATASGNVTIVDSWMHDLDTSADAHTDGVQFTQGAQNVVIRHNNIDPLSSGTGCTSAIIMHTKEDPQNTAVWIEDNRLDGGGCSVALYCPRRPASDVYVNDNRVGRGVFGYTDSCQEGSTATEFDGNVDDVTGQPIPGSSAPDPDPEPEPDPEPGPDPQPSDFPDGSNTGVPAGTTLTPSGGLTIGTAGTVIDSREITGSVTVNAPNVTIRRSRIRGNGFYLVESNSTGLVIEDSELVNRPVAGQPNCHNAIQEAGFTVRRTEMTGCENALGISGDDVTAVDNYIHDLDTDGPSHVFGGSPHTDGIQMTPGSDNITIRHNWVDPTPGGGATSAIIMGVNGSQTGVTIEDNYLDGRGAAYALYVNRQPSTNVFVNRNRMLKGYGYTACVRLGVTVTEFIGNVDDVTGAPLAADNGSDGGCSN
jgi:Right handed beta helix region